MTNYNFFHYVHYTKYDVCMINTYSTNQTSAKITAHK